MSEYIVVAPTGFILYFLYDWTDNKDHWVPNQALALRFSGREARAVADQINARNPGAPHPVRVKRITQRTK